MSHIDYDTLGVYIGRKATEYYNRYYSENIADYEDEIINANELYDEVKDCYKCSIELAEVGKPPLIIEYYCRYTFDDNDNIIDIKYFIEDLTFNFA